MLSVCMYVGQILSTSKGKPLLANENAMTNFRHYYVLRIFHVYKCTVNENTNKSAYWYTSQKSSIPDFAKPGIVAEICPSGFVHSSYLPTDWLTLVWTHPLSQIGNMWVLLQHFCPIMKIGWFPSLVMVEFPVLFDSKVLLAQNHHFGWFPSFFMVHSLVWLQCVFHLKSSGWYLFMVPSVAWLKSALCSKSSFWVVPFTCFSFQCCLAPKYFLLKKWTFCVVPFTCYGSQCCLAPTCFPLKINIFGGSLHFSWFPVLFGSKVISAQSVETVELNCYKLFGQ